MNKSNLCYNEVWNPWNKRGRTSAANWKQPIRWNKKPWVCDECGNAVSDPKALCGMGRYWCVNCGAGSYPVPPFHRRSVFLGSMMDIFDPEVPVEMLAGALDVVRQTPNLQWLLLTKQPELFEQRLYRDLCSMFNSQEGPLTNDQWALVAWVSRWLHGHPPENIAIGTTCENQQAYDERRERLLRIPGRHFLSVEPMVEAIELGSMNGIDLVIFGGESGPNARPCNIEWIRDGIRQCRAAGVKVWVKQLGSRSKGSFDWMNLKHPSGEDPSEWPEDLRVQEGME